MESGRIPTPSYTRSPCPSRRGEVNMGDGSPDATSSSEQIGRKKSVTFEDDAARLNVGKTSPLLDN